MTGGFLQGKVDEPLLPEATIDDVPASGAEVRDAARRLTFDEEMSFSADAALEPFLRERTKKLVELGMSPDLAEFGDSLSRRDRERALGNVGNTALLAIDPDNLPDQARVPSSVFRDQRAAQYYVELQALAEANPGAFRSDDEIMTEVTSFLAAEREANERVLARGDGFNAFLGSAQAGLSEPYMLATLPLGGFGAPARTLLGSAGRTFLREAGIAAATEIPLQAEILDFKRQIDSPYTLRDAAQSVLLTSVAGGGVGASAELLVGGTRQLLSRYFSGNRTSTADEAARVLEEIADRELSLPEGMDAREHSDLIDQALEAFETSGDSFRLPDVPDTVPDAEIQPIARALRDIDEAPAFEQVSSQPIEPSNVDAELSQQFGNRELRAIRESGRTDEELQAFAGIAEDYARLVQERPDLEVPTGLGLDGDEAVTVQTGRLSDIVDEQDTQLQAVKEVELCYMGERA